MDAANNSSNVNQGDVAGNLVQVGHADQVVMQLSGRHEPLYPDMLPRDPLHDGFTNRVPELGELDRLWGAAEQAGEPLVVVLDGMPGIGKTLTLLRWAHRMRERFPGGIFIGDLGGSDPSGPQTSFDVLGFFLGMLGYTHAMLPTTEKARAAAFREITAHRRILLILDDAATAAQVRALLPSSPTSAVLVTSRHKLTFLLKGVHSMTLTPFDEDVAVGLLADSLAEPVEDIMLRKLSRACGWHPMALRTAAAQLRDRPSASSYVDRMVSDLLPRLEVDGEPELAVNFEFGYQTLSEPLRQAYRLLGCHQAPEFRLPAAAALLDVPEPEAEDLLTVLVRANFLTYADGRYRMHALLREHAAAKVDTDTRVSVWRRLVEYYHDFAMPRDAVLSTRRRLSPRYAGVAPVYEGDGAAERALAELEEARPALTAAVRMAKDAGLPDRAWQLCETLFPFYNDSNHYADLIEIHQIGIAAAEELRDPLALVRMSSQYGSAFFGLGDYDQALREFDRCYELAGEDAWGRQSAIEWRGLTRERQGHREEALDCFGQSRRIIETEFPADRRRRPLALYGMHSGRVLVDIGREAEAVPRLEAAFELFSSRRERPNSAKVAVSLAKANRRDLALATEWAGRALELSRAAKMPADQAEVLELLAEFSARRGDAEAAAAQRRAAAEIFAVLGDRRAQALLADPSRPRSDGR